jgi:hypothetical protein
MMGSFSFIHWVITGLIFFGIFKAFKGFFGFGGQEMFCKACGHSGRSKVKTRGSMGIEIVLWLCLLVPGLIYSIWRLTSKGSACESCGSEDLVPPNSPVAVAAKKQLGLGA